MKKRQKINTDNASTAALSGCIAISLLIIQAFITSSNLDTFAFISLSAFAVALPSAVAQLVLVQQARRTQYSVVSKWRTASIISAFTSYIMTLIGLVAALWHTSWIIGIISLMSIMIAIIIYGFYSRELSEVERDLSKEK